MSGIELFEWMSEAECDLLERSEMRVNIRRKMGMRILLVAAVISAFLIMMAWIGAYSFVDSFHQSHPDFDGGLIEILDVVLTKEENALSQTLPDAVKLQLSEFFERMGSKQGQFTPIAPDPEQGSNIHIEEKTQAYIKPTFDMQDVYDHVFQNHSKKLTEQQVEAYQDGTLTLAQGEQEALIVFLFSTNGGDSSWEEGYGYLVKGVTSQLHGDPNATKYTFYVNIYSPLGEKQVYCTADYYEAYLDVMLEHLTFSVCESIPGMEQNVYEIGYIRRENDPIRYLVRADGYIYYEQEDKCYKSEQEVDSAYLAAMMLSTELSQRSRNSSVSSYYTWNESMPTEGRQRYYPSIDRNVLVYENDGYCEEGYVFKYAESCEMSHAYWMGVYAYTVTVYPHVDHNENLFPVPVH